jgi:NAD(P)-dependent dehydrogenase (short-subunit alcohol dehydrogenase family)
MDKLLGRVAIVTGASQGIGKAVALELAREGARLLITARQEDKLDGLAKEIGRLGGQAFAVPADLANVADIQKILANCLSRFSKIDILVNNAGAMSRASIQDLTLEEWDYVYSVNVRAPFLLCKGAAESMRRQKAGDIINISSQRARQGRANRSAYCSTKAALNVFSQSLREEMKPFDIRVHSLILAGFDTPAIRESYPQASPSLWIDPEHLGKLIVFLVTQPGGVDIPELEMRSLAD